MVWDARHAAALIVMCGLAGVTLGWRHAHRLPWPAGSVDPQTIAMGREQLDPNSENDGSLQRLPGIGPTLAEAIVTYRDSASQPAFTNTESLTAVPGIGRVRARRIEPYLQFPDPEEGATP